jgi:hypothetical protein
MSNYQVIADLEKTLKTLLWENIAADENIFPTVINSDEQITLVSPDEMDEGKKLSLFLYRVMEDSHMKNQEMINVQPGLLQYPPLVMELLFLVTCNTGNLEQDHMLMGKVLQVFNDHAILKGPVLRGSLEGTDEEFRIVFYALPFEETINLWQSFREKSFMLSFGYRVTPVEIDSTRQKKVERVSLKVEEG